MRYISFCLLVMVKWLAALFYRFEVSWIGQPAKAADWHHIKLIVFLNHTSLFEPLFIRIAPYSLLWRIATRLVVPGADITINRPWVGRLYKALLPGVVTITRKRDDSWQAFLQQVHGDVLTAILPEGRMKRRNGLDKYGQPMTVRGGVVDILERLDDGKLLFLYSGGLHHVQAPGEKRLRLFKTIQARLELLDINAYKNRFSDKDFRACVLADMQYRLEHCCPGSS